MTNKRWSEASLVVCAALTVSCTRPNFREVCAATATGEPGSLEADPQWQELSFAWNWMHDSCQSTDGNVKEANDETACEVIRQGPSTVTRLAKAKKMSPMAAGYLVNDLNTVWSDRCRPSGAHPPEGATCYDPPEVPPPDKHHVLLQSRLLLVDKILAEGNLPKSVAVKIIQSLERELKVAMVEAPGVDEWHQIGETSLSEAECDEVREQAEETIARLKSLIRTR